MPWQGNASEEDVVSNMSRIVTVAATLAIAAAVTGVLSAQRLAVAQSGAPGFEVKYLNWGNWQTRVGFAQAASVKAAGRLLFLSGVGSEEEMTGTVQHVGDFTAQCNDAWNSIRKILEREGGSVRHIVRVVTYVTDPRSLGANNACKKAVFGDGPYPPHTFLNVSQLALPGMLVEVEVTAALPN
jgi:2-iminobutanoate/2-iminopropanoate deaminase